MAKEIKRAVTVNGETYQPGDEVPADVLKEIDNPKVFEEPDDRTPAEKTAEEFSNRALDSNLKPSGK